MKKMFITINCHDVPAGYTLTTNVLNVSGQLWSATSAETPLLNRVQGNRNFTTSKIFITNSDYTLRPAKQPNISEKMSLIAPDPQHRTRDNKFNVCQIFQEAISTSYFKQANSGLLQGLPSNDNRANSGMANNVTVTEHDWQIARALEAVRLDMEFTLINGEFNLSDSKDANDADRTRGLINTIETNSMDAQNNEFSQELLNEWLYNGRQNNIITSNVILTGSSLTKLAVQKAFKEQPLPQSRTTGGTNITEIVTPFGTFIYEINDRIPNGILLYLHTPSIAIKEMNVPNKGNFFVEKLAKRGGGEEDQIYGIMGVDHGPEWNHMVLKNIKLPDFSKVRNDLYKTGRSARDNTKDSAGVIGGHTTTPTQPASPETASTTPENEGEDKGEGSNP